MAAVAMRHSVPMNCPACPWAPAGRDPAFTFILPRTKGFGWGIGWEGHCDRPTAIHGRLHADPRSARVERRWTQTWDGVVTIINGALAVGLERATHADLRELAAWLAELAGEMGPNETQTACWWLSWGRWNVEFVGWSMFMVEDLRDSLEALLQSEGGLERTEAGWRLSNGA